MSWNWIDDGAQSAAFQETLAEVTSWSGEPIHSYWLAIHADDTSSIELALAAASDSGRPVLAVAGRGHGTLGDYVVSSTVTIPHGVKVLGEAGGSFDEIRLTETPGPIFKLADGANCDMFVNDPDAPIRAGQSGTNRWQRSRFEGITFDGNRANQTDNTVAIFRFTKAWGVAIDRCALLNPAGFGLYTDQCNVIDLLGTCIEGGGRSPAYLLDTQDCTWKGVIIGGAFESSLVLDSCFANQLDGRWHNANVMNTTLTAAISSSVSPGVGQLISTASQASSPVGVQFTITIDTEDIRVTRATGGFTVVARGYNSTVAAAHSNAARVQQKPAHAHGVYLINGSVGNTIMGLADQNYMQSVYVDTSCNFNKIDMICQASGWNNAVAQDALYNDGTFNVFDGTVQKDAGPPANMAFKMGWGPNAARCISNIVADSALGGDTNRNGAAVGAWGQNNLVNDAGGRQVWVPQSGIQSAGPVILNDAVGGGRLDCRYQTSAPATPSANRAVFYFRSSDGAPVFKGSDGVVHPITFT